MVSETHWLRLQNHLPSAHHTCILNPVGLLTSLFRSCSPSNYPLLAAKVTSLFHIFSHLLKSFMTIVEDWKNQQKKEIKIARFPASGISSVNMSRQP